MVSKEKIENGMFRDCSEDQIKELINSAKSRYWKDALWDSSNKNLSNRKAWFENKRKGYFYLITSCPEDSKVLDVGGGSGIISDVVSSFYKNVISLEYNKNLIDFMKLRFNQDKKENINLVRANINNLPFKDKSFNLILLNGILKSLTNLLPEKNPKKVQINFLKQCHLKLNVGGQIIIGIENRIHFNYFIGRSPYKDISCTTVLPRFLANVISKITTGKTYTTYIYSYWGYKKILKKAGFKNIRIYIVIPNYHNPMLILSMTNNSIIYNVLTSQDSLPGNKLKEILYKILLKTGILKYFMHSFYIMGEKS